MREVSVQAANDTNNSQDRANLQAEMNALVTEIDRIAGTTTWAGENLMRDEAGSFFSFQVGTATGEKNQIDITINGMGSNMLGFSTEPRDPDTPDLSDVSVSESGYVAAVPATYNDDAVAYQAEVQAQAATEATPFIPEVPATADGTFSGSTGSFTLAAGRTNVTLTLDSTSVEIDTAPVPAIPSAPRDVSDSNGNKAAVQIIADEINSGTDVHLFTAVANEDGTVTIKAPVVPGATSVLDARDARETIVVIDDAIQTVNIQRSTLGAVSNRLSHTINNLTNISSNLSAAQGGIEDADFAHETTMLAKNQILQQASTAMLAQANASKQNVLSLLQG
jgi:flagellin